MNITLEQFKKGLAKLNSKLGDATLDICADNRNHLRLHSLGSHSTGNLASSIKARKLNNIASVSEMAQYGFYLDNMQPHYVGMNPNIIKWIKERPFGTMTVSGKSYVRFDKKMNPKGALFVTPHPFIDKANDDTLNHITRIIEARIMEAFTS